MAHLHGVRTAWSRIRAIAYRIWLVLVTVKVAIIVALFCLVVADMLIRSAGAATPDQRWHIDDILSTKDAKAIAAQRAQCAVGRAPTVIANVRRLGATTLPDAAPWCIATLTRAGRDGTLTYVRDPLHAGLTPALAFDNGFVSGFLRRVAVPADAPTMAAMQPIAERCLAQGEPDTDLCNAIGVAVGARAAHGDLPVIP